MRCETATEGFSLKLRSADSAHVQFNDHTVIAHVEVLAGACCALQANECLRPGRRSRLWLAGNHASARLSHRCQSLFQTLALREPTAWQLMIAPAIRPRPPCSERTRHLPSSSLRSLKDLPSSSLRSLKGTEPRFRFHSPQVHHCRVWRSTTL